MARTEEVANGTHTNGKSKRGSTDNAARLKGLFANEQGRKADWGSADPRAVAGIVVAVTRRSGAASFGTSRDGGAYSLTLFLDGERETLWFNGNADIDAELEQVFYLLDALT